MENKLSPDIYLDAVYLLNHDWPENCRNEITDSHRYDTDVEKVLWTSVFVVEMIRSEAKKEVWRSLNLLEKQEVKLVQISFCISNGKYFNLLLSAQMHSNCHLSRSEDMTIFKGPSYGVLLFLGGFFLFLLSNMNFCLHYELSCTVQQWRIIMSLEMLLLALECWTKWKSTCWWCKESKEKDQDEDFKYMNHRSKLFNKKTLINKTMCKVPRS